MRRPEEINTKSEEQPSTKQRNRDTGEKVLAILASDKAPVSSRENLVGASLI